MCKLTRPQVIGVAWCEKHQREYPLMNSDSGGCPSCQCEHVHKWAHKTILEAERAHQMAGNSKLIFGGSQ